MKAVYQFDMGAHNGLMSLISMGIFLLLVHSVKCNHCRCDCSPLQPQQQKSQPEQKAEQQQKQQQQQQQHFYSEEQLKELGYEPFKGLESFNFQPEYQKMNQEEQLQSHVLRLVPMMLKQEYQQEQNKLNEEVTRPVYENKIEDSQKQLFKFDAMQKDSFGGLEQYNMPLKSMGSPKQENHQEEDHKHDHDKNVYYKFEYSVNDQKTQDVKHQKEERKADKVNGEYSLLEPDGNVRTVKYYADWKNGFHAEVHNSKKKAFL